ncbi:DNA ligase [Clostridium felsineum]|uniref:DNA ligase n=1 Tax=Clostridium felsineum TaxID=36839 RepID=UPI00098C921B|nr:DNA ligase [Clostridium felsineum]URZ02083.1 hypothetical protein CLAUR_020800 [Clostridium felsineum]
MSKMSELAAEIAELKHCGEILIGISESLAELFSKSEEHTEKQPVKKAAAKKEEKPKEPPKQEKILSLTDVRAVLAEKSRNGYTAEVKALLNKHGADKLSEIDPAEYSALLADAEGIG